MSGALSGSAKVDPNDSTIELAKKYQNFEITSKQPAPDEIPATNPYDGLNLGDA